MIILISMLFQATKQHKKYQAKNDLDGFIKWIDKTKYTPLRIKNECKNVTKNIRKVGISRKGIRNEKYMILQR